MKQSWMLGAGLIFLVARSARSEKAAEKARREAALQTFADYQEFGRDPEESAQAAEEQYRAEGGHHIPFVARLNALAVQSAQSVSGIAPEVASVEDRENLDQAMRASVREGLARDLSKNGLTKKDAILKARHTYRQLGGVDLDFYRELDDVTAKRKGEKQ